MTFKAALGSVAGAKNMKNPGRTDWGRGAVQNWSSRRIKLVQILLFLRLDAFLRMSLQVASDKVEHQHHEGKSL